MTLQRRLAVAVAALLVTLVVAGGLVLLSQRRYVTRQLDAQVAALVARPQATLSLAERAAAGARGGVLSEVWIGTVAPTGAVTTVLAPASDPGLLPRVAPGEVLRVPVGRSTTAGDAPRVRVATGPLKGGTLLVVAVPTQRADAAMGRLALTLALAGAAVLLVVGAIVVWVRRLGLAPIREMTQAADAITAGERDRRIPDAPEGSEAAHLGDALNAMLDATRDSEDRMRQFVADASHELRTPLTTLRGYAELHAGRVEDPDTADALRRIRAEATRMHRLVEDLLTLTSLDRATLHLGPVDVRRMLDDVASDLQVAQPERLVTVEAAAGVRLVADEERLTQAVMALGTNALRHTAVTAAVTRSLRISVVTSLSPTCTRGSSGSVPIASGKSSAAATTAGPSVRSMSCARHHQVRARYIAPVSRYPTPSSRATARETLLLPEPEGPSMATTIGAVMAGE